MRATKQDHLNELTELDNLLADGVINDAEYNKRIKALRKIYNIDKSKKICYA